MSAPPSDKTKKVLIVRAGAAGMACAHHLAQHPENVEVTLIDAADYCGGQVFSIPLDKEKHGTSGLNQGVQGGSYIFHHAMTMFARQGFHADPVDLHVSFGKGDTFWTNVFPTDLLARHQREIRRFEWMMRVGRWFELLVALIPIRVMFKLWMFSDGFTNTVAMPMIALFLGTGNETPNVPFIILERLCTSPTYGLWYPPDRQSIASNLPPMVVFPNFTEFYGKWKDDLVSKGVKVRLSTEVTRVVKRDKDGVIVKTIQRTPKLDGHNPNSAWVPYNPSNADQEVKEEIEHYDEIVLCVLADTAKRILEPTASFLETKILGSAKFSDDLTITHWDVIYMKKHYENVYNESQAVSTLSGVDQSHRLAFARESFKPMYYIKMYPQDPSKLEMSAVDLGATYPEDLERDRFALLCFRLYYLLVYGKWYRRRATKHTKEGPGKEWASGWYGSMYRGPGVGRTDRKMWREENGIEGERDVYEWPVDAGARRRVGAKVGTGEGRMSSQEGLV
ncbi:hypothetical protein BKA70DRAFT_1433577 [Coprinopsis sp. MPI-PUGE-AT-0042]|nr:hypothetical protein BKA70DRAFT_1433577 [Coprinopsis sp. MPI-PUGE-AT-0042]